VTGAGGAAAGGVEAQLRHDVAVSCRILGHRGVTRGAFGHVSARVPGTDRILIKGRGPGEAALEFTRPRDVITLDLHGRVLEGADGIDSPNETAMHLAVYRARPEVGSVIHTHPDWVVVLTACRKPLLPLFGAYNPPAMRLAVEGLPVYPRSVTIVDDQLGAEFMAVMGDRPACLLHGHGLTTAGPTVQAATATSLAVLELARLNVLAYGIGQPEPVPAEDIAEYRARWREEEQRGAGRRPSRSPAAWRYELRLLERAGLYPLEDAPGDAPA
jgi:ribulose-5-phosphate 4-epimerase/fuculose-1-phosphate aldolase